MRPTHKIQECQELLLTIAFGVQPSKARNGQYETHGGYIVVKKRANNPHK